MCVIIFYFIRTLRAQVQYPRGMGKKTTACPAFLKQSKMTVWLTLAALRVKAAMSQMRRQRSVSRALSVRISMRPTRRLEPPCLRAFHSPSPSALMPVQSMSRLSGPVEPRYGRLTFSVFWRRHKVLKSGVARSSPTSRSRLWTTPVVWRSGMPNRTFSVKQV
jgi:hypothetical protein